MKKVLLFLFASFLFSYEGHSEFYNVGEVSTRAGSTIEVNQDSYYGKPLANHVFLLALDGWSANSFAKLNIPNIKKLVEEGCVTLTKRSVLPSSSAPNWASMFMGAGTEAHGYTEWGSKTPEIPSQALNHHNIFPTIFYLLKDQHPEKKVGVLYEWDGIEYLIDKNAVDYQKRAEYDNGDLKKKAVEYIKNEKPNLLAVVWDGPDHAGHSAGWGTQTYLDKIEEVDGYIGEIIQATKEAGIYKKTIFIVTADHGGINKSHGGKTDDEMHTPFIISGKNVKEGHQIATTMMQFGVAATIAYIFKLRRPEVWWGRPVTEVFEK